MNTSLLIEKDGILKIVNIKDKTKLYSICNFRNNNNFELLYTWKSSVYNYELYGKKKSKGTVKNIYIMPYPIHKEVFYGSLCVIKKMEKDIVSMTMNDWNLICNKELVLDNDNLENNDINEEEKDTFQQLLKNRGKELTHEEYEYE
jgi:hypothetical protein